MHDSIAMVVWDMGIRGLLEGKAGIGPAGDSAGPACPPSLLLYQQTVLLQFPPLAAVLFQFWCPYRSWKITMSPQRCLVPPPSVIPIFDPLRNAEATQPCF